MPSPEDVNLGWEFFLGSLFIGGGVMVIKRIAPRANERVVAMVIGCLLGLFLIWKGTYGLPAAGTVRARVNALVPYVGAAIWMFMAFRFWLSQRKDRLETATRLDRQGETLDSIVKKLEPPAEPPTPDIRSAQQVQEDWNKFANAAENGALPGPGRSPNEPDWKKWLRRDQVELWVAVLLSHSIEPNTWEATGLGSGDPKRLDTPYLGLKSHMEEALSHVGQSLGSTWLREHRHLSMVKITVFAAWAHRAGWSLPTELLVTGAVTDGLTRR